MNSRIGRLEQHVENQERYNRRETLIFYDLPGEKEERHETTTEKLIKSSLVFQAKDVLMAKMYGYYFRPLI